jgi:hypothetical protein
VQVQAQMVALAELAVQVTASSSLTKERSNAQVCSH